jgi:hypothetical protein
MSNRARAAHRSTYVYGSYVPLHQPQDPPAPECPRCETELVPAELADGHGTNLHVLRCILCGAYVEPGHVPDDQPVRAVRGPRGPRRQH